MLVLCIYTETTLINVDVVRYPYKAALLIWLHETEKRITREAAVAKIF